jgi:hypothetical protein
MKTIAKNIFLMVDVSSIAPLTRNPEYKPELIEQLADSIIEAGGLITPLIVKPTGLTTYKLADEYSQGLELLAVIRAKEKEPRLCEMVNCFVVSDDCTPHALNQLDIIKNIARYAR